MGDVCCIQDISRILCSFFQDDHVELNECRRIPFSLIESCKLSILYQSRLDIEGDGRIFGKLPNKPVNGILVLRMKIFRDAKGPTRIYSAVKVSLEIYSVFNHTSTNRYKRPVENLVKGCIGIITLK
jgi:hypothetical protein